MPALTRTAGVAIRYLIHCVDESTVDWWDDGPTDPQSNEEIRAVEAWNAEMNARGIMAAGGFLQPTSAATTIKVRDGEVPPGGGDS